MGVDPGVRNQAGVFIRDRRKPEITKSVVRPARVHFQQAGFPAMNHKRHKLTKEIDIHMKSTTEATLQKCHDDLKRNIIPQPDKDLIKDDLLNFDEKFDAYSRPKLVKIKFTHHLRTHKATDQFVSSLVGREKGVKVFFGNGWSGFATYKG